MKLKRLIVLSLVLSLSIGGLTACKQTDGSGKNNVAAQTQSVGNNAEKKDNTTVDGVLKVSAPGVLPIVEEKMNLSVMISKVETVSTMAYGENKFTTALEDATNVHLDMVEMEPSSYMEKLNLLLNSNDYPEVIMSAEFKVSDLIKYGTKEEILIPLNTLIDENCVNIQKRWAENPYLKGDMTLTDGNIYGLPYSEGPEVGHGAVNYKAWINNDWLDALNLQRPTTTEEFREVLRAFKTMDPNGNGIADEVPLTGAPSTWGADPYLFILNAFGYYEESLFMLNNDTFSKIADQDYFKEGLIYLKELYDEGLIDPAAFTQSAEQLTALGNNEDAVVVGVGTAGHLGMIMSVDNTERLSQYDALEPLKGPTGYRGIPFTTDRRASGARFAITDRCQTPQVAIKIADLLCGDEWVVLSQVGVKGEGWDDADPGTFGMDGVTPATRKYLDFVVGQQRSDIWGMTARVTEPNWKNTFQVEGDIYDPSNYEAFLYRETEKLRDYAAPVQQMSPLFFETQDSERVSQLKVPIQDYVKNAIVEYVTGAKDIDSTWDTYLAGLENLGYTEYVELYQKTYDAGK